MRRQLARIALPVVAAAALLFPPLLRGVDCPGPPTEGVGDVCPAAPMFGVFDYGPNAGRFPRVVVGADMNGDGQTELVTGNRDFNGASEVAVLFSQGDRSFRTVSSEAGEELQNLVVVDLDGDGDADVATANEDRLLVLKNTGDGTLGAPLVLAADTRTRAITAADLNADGLPELLSTSQSSDTVAVYRNLGGGRFAPPQLTPAPGRPAALLTADLDSDGVPEVLVADGSLARLLVFAVSENGALVEQSIHPAGGTTPASLQAADLNGDGVLDIVVRVDRAVAILYGTGTGRLHPATVINVLAANASSVVVTDANGDDHFDFIIGHSSPNEAVVYLGDGNGGFEPSHFDLWVVPRALTTADLDGDGDPELVFIGVSFPHLAILWGGEPHLAPPPVFSRREVVLGGRPHGAELGDFNGDGIDDVVTSSGDDVTIYIVTSEDGRPLAKRSSLSIRGTGRTFGAATADLDGDGDIDFAVGDNETNVIGVLFNAGDGSFGRGATYGGVSRPRRIIAADVTGDGPIDLITADSAANQLSLFRNQGDGVFDASVSIPVGSQPLSVAAADLDGDGTLELISANSVSNDISILTRQGTRFNLHSLLFTVGQPRDIVAVDLDTDGVADLATANGVTEDVNVFFNDGRAGFETPLAFHTGQIPYSLRPGDLNGDGVLDIATGNFNSDSVSILLSKGGRDFHVPFLYSVGTEPRFVMTSDFDLDGNIDLVTANRQSRNLSLLTNTTHSDVLFRRSDVDGDGRYTIGDALGVLRYLVGAAEISCTKSADGNDDGAVNLTDALHITNQLFLRGPPPPPPGDSCGVDPTADALSCATHACHPNQ